MIAPPGRSRSVAVVAMCVSLCLFLWIPVARAATHSPPSSAGLRSQVLDLVNRSRSSHGLSALRLSLPLSAEALAHSRRMARSGDISHTANLVDLIHRMGGTVFGEDVARGRGLRGIYGAWLQRTDTRNVLLDPRFRIVGVGVVHIGGFYWVTLQAFD